MIKSKKDPFSNYFFILCIFFKFFVLFCGFGFISWFCSFFCFETRSHVAQDHPAIHCMAENDFEFLSSWLYLWSAQIMWFMWSWGLNPGHCAY